MKQQQSGFGRLNGKKLVFHLLAFSFMPSICSSASCCAVCDCRGHEVWCEERELTSIPSNIPDNTRRLYMFNNNISSIHEGAFAELKNLELLDLRSNQLTSDGMEGRIFRGLSHLQDLLLSENKLSKITKTAFTGIPHLMRLYLEDNVIELIENEAFSNLHSLLELKLGRNRLSNFPPISNCSNLRRLRLNHNNLVRLKSGGLNGVNLEQLSLSYNQLHQLPSTIFSDVSNMRELELDRNRINRLPRIISQMSSLRSLNLSGNPISSLPQDFLSNLQRMKVLDLSDLQLTTLRKGFIPFRVYLNIFDISGNPWRCDCSLDWILDYMRAVAGVFVRMSQVQCAAPLHLRDRRLESLHGNDLNCDRAATTVSLYEEPCSGLICLHGGKCTVDPIKFVPLCRCPSGWTGQYCDRADVDAKTSAITKLDNSKLFIPGNRVTVDSVEIVFPITSHKVTITVTEMKDNGNGWSSTESFYPTSNFYTIDKLKPFTTYKICFTAFGVSEERLCEIVTTKEPAIDSDSNIAPVVPETDSIATHVKSEILISDEDLDGIAEKDSLSQNENFNLLYPVLGACVAICLIVASGILIFVCRRKRFGPPVSRIETDETLSVSKTDELRPCTTQESLSMIESEYGYKKGQTVTSCNDLSSKYGGQQQQQQQQKCFYAVPSKKTTNLYKADSMNKCKTLNENDLKFLRQAHEEKKCFTDVYDTLPKECNYYYCNATSPPCMHSNKKELHYPATHSAVNNQRQDCMYLQQYHPSSYEKINSCRGVCCSPVHKNNEFTFVSLTNHPIMSDSKTPVDPCGSLHHKVAYELVPAADQTSKNFNKNLSFQLRHNNHSAIQYGATTQQKLRTSSKVTHSLNQPRHAPHNAMVI